MTQSLSSSPEVEIKGGSRFFGICWDDANDFSPVLLQFVMTEVFAGINHRLSEVYGNIELPNQDSKAR